MKYDDTINYYDINANEYFALTSKANITTNCDKFINYLDNDSYILDFGCGSGRDSKYFISKGYKVDALDGSKKLASLASKLINQEVTGMNFLDSNENDKYNAVWACSS